MQKLMCRWMSLGSFVLTLTGFTMFSLVSTLLPIEASCEANESNKSTVASPAFDSHQWDLLVRKIEREGVPFEDPNGAKWFSLERVTSANPLKSRQAEYISTIGSFVGKEYVVYGLSAVSEEWNLNDEGHWDIQQWIHSLSAQGALLRVAHNHLVETPDGLVLLYEALPADEVSSPAALARWGAKLDRWFMDLPLLIERI